MGKVISRQKDTAEGDGPGPKRRKTEDTPIDEANRASSEEFVKQYMQPAEGWSSWKDAKSGETYTLSLVSSSSLPSGELTQCLALVEETSGSDYRKSSWGWRPGAKKKEMQSPDLRYLLLKDDGGQIRGFTSLMPTWEDGKPVLYCYEVHLKEGLQGTGLGRLLMSHVEASAENINWVEKVMLTCFLSNEKALGFYKKLGFVKDEFSPGERKLRGGKVVVPDYVILSKRTRYGEELQDDESNKSHGVK